MNRSLRSVLLSRLKQLGEGKSIDLTLPCRQDGRSVTHRITRVGPLFSYQRFYEGRGSAPPWGGLCAENALKFLTEDL